MKNKILILSRGSLSTNQYTPSRSIFCRVFEPIAYLKEKELIKKEIDILKSNEITEENIINYNVIVFCKHNDADSVRVARLANKNRIKIIYDIDDLIHRVAEDSAAFQFMKNHEYLKEIIELSDVVVASTEKLNEVIASDFSLKKTVVIRTGINIEKYKKNEYKPDYKKILFTNGDNIKVNFFRTQFVQVFNDFLKRNPDTQFQIFGDSEAYVNEFSRYEFLGSLPWDEHKLWLMKNQIEFAIIPLGSAEENEVHRLFSDCKTPIKYLEYGAMRIPGVYSKAPIYNEVIQNNETGILVENNVGAWLEALDEVHGNKKLRKKIADQAFEDIRAKHHIKIAAEKWIEVLER